MNPNTGISSPEVSQMLQTYRQDTRVDGAITFGMNAMVLEQTEAQFELQLAVGQQVRAELKF